MRQVTKFDIENCADVLHESFTDFATQYNLPSDFPTKEYALNSISYVINHPNIFGVVEEIDKEIVGLGFIYERDEIYTIGPIATAKRFQGKGVAKKIVKNLLERKKNSLGVRLVTDTFNSKSLSLYMKLGFKARETCLVIKGRPKTQHSPQYKIRPLNTDDLEECAILCKNVHGIERTNELKEAIHTLSPYVAIFQGRIVAYTTTMTRWHRGHGVAYNEKDMEALILGVGKILPDLLTFLIPMSQTNIINFCFRENFEVIKPMTLLSTGIYQVPEGCYFPSVLY